MSFLRPALTWLLIWLLAFAAPAQAVQNMLILDAALSARAAKTGLIRDQVIDHNGDYGETLTEQGTVYNPFRWNGEQLDPESGLYYLRNRYYQPSTGRFMQRDPIGYEGGLNLYAYCNGDPIQGADPSGLAEEDRAIQFGWRLWKIATQTGEVAAPFVEEEAAGASMGPYGVGAVVVWQVLRNLPGTPSRPLPPGRNRVTPPSGPITIPLPGPGGTSGGRPFFPTDPYSPEKVEERNQQPRYETNPAHVPGPTFNPRKSPEPVDAATVFSTSTRTDWHVYWGRGSTGQYYRFFYDQTTGAAHFSGSYEPGDSRIPPHAR